MREDGIVERSGAGGWLPAAILFAGTARTHRKFGMSAALDIFLLSGLAVRGFLTAGEEISRSRWHLGYATPDIVAQINLQEWTSTHGRVPFGNHPAVDGMLEPDWSQ